MARTIRLTDCMPDALADTLAATYLDARHFHTLLAGEDVDVLRPDGSLLLALRHRALPADVCRGAYPALLRAATPTDNRGTAAGGGWDNRMLADGTISRTRRANVADSGIIGFMDRSARFPYCRTTAYTARDVQGWVDVLPFIRAVDGVFARECPDRYAAQMSYVRATPPDWVIPGTAFTTVTVNRNFRTAAHKDAGDLPAGFGVVTVLERGRYGGGYLVFPQHQVAVDIRDRDVLLADVHEWHGNTPLVGIAGESERVSAVLYYRADMWRCLPPAAELDRLKRRRPGDALG